MSAPLKTIDLFMQDYHQCGDAPELFAALFRQHGRAVYRSIRAMIPHASDVEDVFQETAVTLWQKFDQYRPELDFRAWACRIAYYKALKLRGRQVRSPRLFSPEFLELISGEMIEMADTLDARSDALLLCRKKLNERDRNLLERFHREGATAKLVARQIKRNTRYVYRAIERIHAALLDCIQAALGRDHPR